VTGLDHSAGQPNPSQTKTCNDLSADLIGVARVAASSAKNATATTIEKCLGRITLVSPAKRQEGVKTYSILTRIAKTPSHSYENSKDTIATSFLFRSLPQRENFSRFAVRRDSAQSHNLELAGTRER
jgi:hypothetical protein